MIDLREYVKTRKGTRQYSELRNAFPDFDLDLYNKNYQFLLLVERGESMIEAYKTCNCISGDAKEEIVELEADVDSKVEQASIEVNHAIKKPIRDMETQGYLIALIIEGVAIFFLPAIVSGYRTFTVWTYGIMPVFVGLSFLYMRKEMRFFEKVIITLPAWLVFIWASCFPSFEPNYILSIFFALWIAIDFWFYIIYTVAKIIRYLVPRRKRTHVVSNNTIREESNKFNGGVFRRLFGGKLIYGFASVAGIGAWAVIVVLAYGVYFAPVYILPINFWLKLALVLFVGTLKNNIFINVPLWIVAMVTYFKNDYSAFIDIIFWVSFVIDCFSTVGTILQLQQKRNGF